MHNVIIPSGRVHEAPGVFSYLGNRRAPLTVASSKLFPVGRERSPPPSSPPIMASTGLKGENPLVHQHAGQHGMRLFGGQENLFLGGVITTNIWPAGRQPFFQGAATRAKSPRTGEEREGCRPERKGGRQGDGGRPGVDEPRRKSDNANIGRTISLPGFNRF